MTRNLRFSTLLVTALIGLTSAAPAGDWTVYSNVKNVRRLLVDSSHVYAVTSGGLYRHDDQGDGYRVYNSGDGLGSHDLRAAALVGDTIWMGGEDAILTRFVPQAGDARVFPLSLGMQRINALLSLGDTLWVGSDIGLGLFLKSEAGGILKEVYTQLGGAPAEASVNELRLFQDRLWIITPFGVVSAIYGDPSLHIASRWTDYGDPDGALRAAHSLEIWNDSLYVGTDSGLYVLEDSQFAARFTIREVRGMFADGDTLWMATDSGVFIYHGDSAVHHTSNNLGDSRIQDIARVPDGELWISVGRANLFHFGDPPWFHETVINQPDGTVFSGVAVLDGAVWTAHQADGGGFFSWSGIWSRAPGITPSAGAPSFTVRSANGSVYFPGHGQGLFVFTPDADTLVTVQYTALNSAFAPVTGSVNYTVVLDVAVDPLGGIWANNGTTNNNEQSLVYISPGGATQVTFGPDDGMVSSDVSVLLLEGSRLWIGHASGGLGVLDFNNTPTVKTDDRYWVFTNEQDGLPANAITALARGYDGKIWIGTPGGLARWDPEFFPFPVLDFANLQPADAEVTALVSDRANRIWVGTGHGLARLPAGGLVAESTWFAGSSSLPDNRVLSLANDEQRPALWVGTENGLAMRSVLVREAVPSPRVFPNPFHLRFASDVATFDVSAGSRIDIYTLAGDRVRTLRTTFTWNGTNDDGLLVASGLYLFRVTYDDGTTGHGRIGIIVDR